MLTIDKRNYQVGEKQKENGEFDKKKLGESRRKQRENGKD